MLEIKDNSLCSGCHACYSACPKRCIKMISDEEGFLYPQIDTTLCTNCSICIKTCPILTPISNKKTIDEINAYAAYSNNETIRLASSSGGMFTEIATYVINNDGVVFGAALNNNQQVEHISVKTIDELSRLRGSKYVQSTIGDILFKVKEELDNNKLVLFTGTPCQIHGLHSYLKHDYDNLITADIICHGVPSPLAWKKYLTFIENEKKEKILSISFRNKDNGWQNYSLKFQFENNIEINENHKKNIFMTSFLTNLCLRPSCYNCKFKSKIRISDFTLADFWGIDNVIENFNDNKGTSLILLNSNRAKEIFKIISQKITYKQVDIHQALQYNPSAFLSVKKNKNRTRFFKKISSNLFDKVVKKYAKKSKFKLFIYRLINKTKKLLLIFKSK